MFSPLPTDSGKPSTQGRSKLLLKLVEAAAINKTSDDLRVQAEEERETSRDYLPKKVECQVLTSMTGQSSIPVAGINRANSSSLP